MLYDKCTSHYSTVSYTIITAHIAYCKLASDTTDLDPLDLRGKIPDGTEYDNTLYTTLGDALLRLGIILGSSIETIMKDGETKGLFSTNSSGILVVNCYGEFFFITIVSYRFNDILILVLVSLLVGLCKVFLGQIFPLQGQTMAFDTRMRRPMNSPRSNGNSISVHQCLDSTKP